MEQKGVLKLLSLENTGKDAGVTESSADRVTFILYVASQLFSVPRQVDRQGDAITYQVLF